MKTVLLYACAIFLMSCQKEVMLPHQVKEEPKEVVIPEPEPEPEPPTVPESEEVYLRDLPNHFIAQNHFKLSKVYSDNADLWESTPDWSKDDIHTFNDFGDGSIESFEQCPKTPFDLMPQNWSAYADDEGVRLTWVDLNYNPVTFVLKSIAVGKSFTVYYKNENDEKIYLNFQLIVQK